MTLWFDSCIYLLLKSWPVITLFSINLLEVHNVTKIDISEETMINEMIVPETGPSAADDILIDPRLPIAVVTEIVQVSYITSSPTLYHVCRSELSALVLSQRLYISLLSFFFNLCLFLSSIYPFITLFCLFALSRYIWYGSY